MATRVGEVLEIELQNGQTVEVRPLSIKRLRKFMELVKKFEDIDPDENSDENIDLMIEACAIALEKSAPELAGNREELEETLDIPTIWKILEVAGGIQVNQGNLPVKA